MILIYVANNQLLKWIPFFLAEANNWSVFIPVFVVVLMFLAVLGLCIYQVFTTREKTDFEKKIMLGFAVLTNMLTGVIAGTYVIRNAAVHDWQLVFPIWNIVNGVLLLLMLRFGIIDEECISNREATPVQIVPGLIAVIFIFILCNYVFKLYWAITFSICIVYTTSFDRALQNIFPGLANREDEQPS
jgi:phosphatidylserine synthase